MSDVEQDSGERVQDTVYESAVRLLTGYFDEEYEVRAWVLGSQIVNDTGLDKAVVMDALRELGDGRLYVNEVAGGHDLQVVGVDHRSLDVDGPVPEPPA